MSTRKRWLVILAVAAAMVVMTFAVGEAVISTAPVAFFGLLGLSFLAAILVVAPTIAPSPGEGEAEAALRQGSLRHSSEQLALDDVMSKGLDASIPIEAPGMMPGPASAASFVRNVAAGAPELQVVLEGGSGCGKSTVLHRIAEALCAAEDRPPAVVVPLATYDWEQERFSAWLGAEIAHITGVRQAAVERLIIEERLFVLLDGIEDIPNDIMLNSQAFPDSELSLVEQWSRRRSHLTTNPRQKLIANLAKLPGFLLTARSSTLSERERGALGRYRRAEMTTMDADEALRHLYRRAAHLESAEVSDAFVKTIRTPLYVRLAGTVCGEHDETPPPLESVPELERWLWDRYLSYRLASRELKNLEWEPDQVRRWLAQCAAALPATRPVLSLRRWPLLYPAAMRFFLRLFRAVVSGMVAALIAGFFLRLPFAALVGLLCGIVFLLAGEGTATRPLGVQRFGPRRFARVVLTQAGFVPFFVAVGGFVGFVVSVDPLNALSVEVRISAWEAILTGLVGGALFVLVPTLWELFYLDEAALYAPRYRDGAIAATAFASVAIGLVGATIVTAALAVAFPTTLQIVWVFPAAVVLCLLETLGLSYAAVGLWALQGRGPLDVDAFLRLADEIRVARRLGQYHLLEHSELRRFLIEEEKGEEHAEAAGRAARVSLVGSVAVAVWLGAYALLYLVNNLPATYAAAHWETAWVGLDLAMASLALVTFVLLRRRSILAAFTAAMLSAMLLCDGWFDCLTARADDLVEALVSLGAELPAAAFFAWIAFMVLRRAERDAHRSQPAN